MATNFYIINKSELAADPINKKIEELAQETATKLSQIRDLDRQEFNSVINAINEFKLERVKQHIGKSSFGWRFTFHADIKSFANFQAIFDPETMLILDEYDRPVDFENLKLIISASLQNPKRDTNGKEISDNEMYGDRYMNFNDEGFYVSSGDFS